MQYTFIFMHYPNIHTLGSFYDPKQRYDLTIHRFAAVMIPDDPNSNHNLFDVNWRLYCNTKVMVITDSQGKDIILKPRKLYLIPPWQICSRRELVHSEHIFVHFSAHWLMRSFISQAWTIPVVHIKVPRGIAQLKSLAHQMLAHSGQLGAVEHLTLTNLINTCLSAAINQLPDKQQKRLNIPHQMHPQLLNCLQYIENHLNEDLSATVLASITCTSETHLRRLFKQTFDTTPNAYVNEKRIARAAELLINTQDSIETIAAQTGFSQRFYFTRTFSKFMGQPPAQYRKLNQLFI